MLFADCGCIASFGLTLTSWSTESCLSHITLISLVLWGAEILLSFEDGMSESLALSDHRWLSSHVWISTTVLMWLWKHAYNCLLWLPYDDECRDALSPCITKKKRGSHGPPLANLLVAASALGLLELWSLVYVLHTECPGLDPCISS